MINNLCKFRKTKFAQEWKYIRGTMVFREATWLCVLVVIVYINYLLDRTKKHCGDNL